MPDYSKAKVYKLVHVDADDEFGDMYIGSTTASLAQRLSKHRGDARKGGRDRHFQWMRDVGVENVAIVLLENCPCASFEEQRQHERRWCDELKPSLNSVRPYITRDEKRAADRQLYLQNREICIERARQFRKCNKFYVAAVQKEWRERQGEALKEKKRKYYADNRDEIRARQKAKRAENAELRAKQSAYHCAYYHANKERILANERAARRAKGVKSPKRYATEEDRKAARREQFRAARERNPEAARARTRAWRAKKKLEAQATQSSLPDGITEGDGN